MTRGLKFYPTKCYNNCLPNPYEGLIIVFTKN